MYGQLRVSPQIWEYLVPFNHLDNNINPLPQCTLYLYLSFGLKKSPYLDLPSQKQYWYLDKHASVCLHLIVLFGELDNVVLYCYSVVKSIWKMSNFNYTKLQTKKQDIVFNLKLSEKVASSISQCLMTRPQLHQLCSTGIWRYV